MIWNQDNLFLKSILFRSFLNLSKSITHDSDQHVHEYNGNNERAKKEHSHGIILCCSILVLSCIKIPKSSNHVDSKYRVNDTTIVKEYLKLSVSGSIKDSVWY